MKKIFFYLAFSSLLGAVSIDDNSTYLINLKQIQNIQYHNDKLTIELKKEYWEPLLDFSIKHINKQTKINIDTLEINPYMMDIVYHNLELTLSKKTLINDKLKAIVNKKIISKNSDQEEIIFLHKMLRKYSHNYNIIENLIYKYHEINTIQASNECINIYEASLCKEKIIYYNYKYIFDCYADLNDTKNAFIILKLAKKYIEKNEEYEILEKEALLYKLDNNLKQSKRFYQLSLDSLINVDFSPQMINLTKYQKKQILQIKNNETKRIRHILLTL